MNTTHDKTNEDCPRHYADMKYEKGKGIVENDCTCPKNHRDNSSKLEAVDKTKLGELIDDTKALIEEIQKDNDLATAQHQLIERVRGIIKGQDFNGYDFAKDNKTAELVGEGVDSFRESLLAEMEKLI